MPVLRTLLSGLVVGESPRWHDGRLWLCDWGAREVVAVDADGRRETIDVNTYAWSIDWLPDGRLLVVSSSDRRLLRREVDGSLAVHSDVTGIWNELVVDDRGNAYIDSIGFDLTGGEDFRPGSIFVAALDGSTRQVADDLMFPNGMTITPDRSTLIVAESYGKRLTAFDIDADGGLSNRRVWADLGIGTPDGICSDAEGTVWYADVPNKRCVRVREGGEEIEIVDVGLGCFACMLGGDEGRTLHIVTAEWRGPQHMFDEPRTGCVLTTRASAGHDGRP